MADYFTREQMNEIVASIKTRHVLLKQGTLTRLVSIVVASFLVSGFAILATGYQWSRSGTFATLESKAIAASDAAVLAKANAEKLLEFARGQMSVVCGEVPGFEAYYDKDAPGKGWTNKGGGSFEFKGPEFDISFPNSDSKITPEVFLAWKKLDLRQYSPNDPRHMTFLRCDVVPNVNGARVTPYMVVIFDGRTKLADGRDTFIDPVTFGTVGMSTQAIWIAKFPR